MSNLDPEPAVENFLSQTFYVLYNDGPEDPGWHTAALKSGGQMLPLFTSRKRATVYRDEWLRHSGEYFDVTGLPGRGDLLTFLRVVMLAGVLYVGLNPQGGEANYGLILRLLAEAEGEQR
jgi:hypothetical protein